MRGWPVGLMSLAMIAGCSSGESPAPDPAAATVSTASNATASEPARNNDEQVMDAGPTSAAGLPAGYEARGQEPGWLLVIDAGRIDYAGSYGDKHVNVPLPPAAAQPDGLSYTTPQLVVRVRYRRCNDAMSGEAYEHEVEVTAAGETHGGCGGERRPAWDL
jgi:uncharacterized membrane protein